MSVSDQTLTFLVGIVSAILGFFTARAATRQRQEETLNSTVDKRVTFILNEQKARITELKSELHQVKVIVESFRDVIQAVLLASLQCPHASKGLCPITNNDLSEKLSRAMRTEVLNVPVSE